MNSLNATGGRNFYPQEMPPLSSEAAIFSLIKNTSDKINHGSVHVSKKVDETEMNRAHTADAFTHLYDLYKDLKYLNSFSDDEINGFIDRAWKIAQDRQKSLQPVSDESLSVKLGPDAVRTSWTESITQLSRLVGTEELDLMDLGEKACFFIDPRRADELVQATGNERIKDSPFTALIFENNDPGYLKRSIDAWAHIGTTIPRGNLECIDFKSLEDLNRLSVGKAIVRDSNPAGVNVEVNDLSQEGLEDIHSILLQINGAYSEAYKGGRHSDVLFHNGKEDFGIDILSKSRTDLVPLLQKIKSQDATLALLLGPHHKKHVEEIFNAFLSSTKKIIKESKDPDLKRELVIRLFKTYELLHPHFDGNTRTAMLGINLALKDLKLPPFLLTDPNYIDGKGCKELLKMSDDFLDQTKMRRR